jgi:octaprenyl-diphosphate synthase
VTTELNGASLFSLIERDLQRVRAALREVSQGFQESTRTLLEHAGADRGKLLRPALLLLSGTAFGAVTPDHIRAATVLELIHNATLLHDDVLDQGHLRRGQPTVNRRWGNPVAVRLGDALLSQVLALSIHLPPDVRATVGRVIRRTCDGEIRQAGNAGNVFLTEREYLAIVGSKTAALFEGACHLGARLADASPHQRWAAARFGYSTGMAYQIMDDLLDLVGDRRVLRKTLGTDLRSTKLTLPLIHALCVAGEPARALLQCKLRARSLARGELLAVLAAGESVDYVLARIRRYERRAAAALRDVRATPGKAALLAVPCSIWHEAVEGSRDHRGLSRPRPAARGAPRPAGGRA